MIVNRKKVTVSKTGKLALLAKAVNAKTFFIIWFGFRGLSRVYSWG